MQFSLGLHDLGRTADFDSTEVVISPTFTIRNLHLLKIDPRGDNRERTKLGTED